MKTCGLCLCLGLLLLASCTRKSAPAPAPEPPTTPAADLPAGREARIDELIYNGLGLGWEETRDGIVSVLGEPDDERSREVQNRHDPSQADRIHTLGYPGLRIELYQATESDRQFLIYMEVTAERWPVQWGLRVGTSRQEIEAVLDQPLRESEGTLVYAGSGPASSEVAFHITDNRVSKIEWRFFYD